MLSEIDMPHRLYHYSTGCCVENGLLGSLARRRPNWNAPTFRWNEWKDEMFVGWIFPACEKESIRLCGPNCWMNVCCTFLALSDIILASSFSVKTFPKRDFCCFNANTCFSVIKRRKKIYSRLFDKYLEYRDEST